MRNLNRILAAHGMAPAPVTEKIQHSNALDRLAELEKQWDAERLASEPRTTEPEPEEETTDE